MRRGHVRGARRSCGTRRLSLHRMPEVFGSLLRIDRCTPFVRDDRRRPEHQLVPIVGKGAPRVLLNVRFFAFLGSDWSRLDGHCDGRIRWPDEYPYSRARLHCREGRLLSPTERRSLKRCLRFDRKRWFGMSAFHPFLTLRIQNHVRVSFGSKAGMALAMREERRRDEHGCLWLEECSLFCALGCLDQSNFRSSLVLLMDGARSCGKFSS